eukprot:GHVU01117387.1.p1 GENE.GHVU01117387.1~~GHVU01117387.1.p1  ORF type:complete len:104 (+),score=5.78 GHVU01117387.1:9-320(+)
MKSVLDQFDSAQRRLLIFVFVASRDRAGSRLALFSPLTRPMYQIFSAGGTAEVFLGHRLEVFFRDPFGAADLPTLTAEQHLAFQNKSNIGFLPKYVVVVFKHA